MKQIVLRKDEKRVVPVLLGSHPREPEVLDRIPKKSDSIASLQSDKGKEIQGKSERLDIILAGEGAEIEVIGLLMANGERQTAFEVFITHAAPRTKSKVNVRAVLRNKSTFAFRGNVRIEKGAKGADAYLRSDALLFDEAKMGDDTPALEILERDVKAGHAATVGKVDEQMLFYLMSRGLGKRQAEKLLIEGFVNPICRILRANAVSREVPHAIGGSPRGRTIRQVVR